MARNAQHIAKLIELKTLNALIEELPDCQKCTNHGLLSNINTLLKVITYSTSQFHMLESIPPEICHFQILISNTKKTNLDTRNNEVVMTEA